MKNTQLPVLTKEYQRQAAGMIRQYADKLIQMGYGFTRRQLKEMNYIDVQEFFEKKSNHNSMKREYLDLGKTIPQDQYFYYLIPCYKEGVFYIGMDQYMYWQVKDWVEITVKRKASGGKQYESILFSTSEFRMRCLCR